MIFLPHSRRRIGRVTLTLKFQSFSFGIGYIWLHFHCSGTIPNWKIMKLSLQRILLSEVGRCLSILKPTPEMPGADLSLHSFTVSSHSVRDGSVERLL